MLRRFVLAMAFVAFTVAIAYSDVQNVRIYSVDVDGKKITWKKVKIDPDTKKATKDVEDKAYTSAVTADTVYEKAAGGGKAGKAGKGKAVDPTPLEGGLKGLAELVTKAGEKGIAASVETTKDNGEGDAKKVSVKGGGGGKGKAAK